LFPGTYPIFFKPNKEKQMNVQLLVLYETCCKQSVAFLEKALKKVAHPHETCDFFQEGACTSDFFCRQLARKPAVGSWFSDMLQLKKQLKPGEAVYARRNDTGGLTVTTDPFPYIGHSYPKERDGTILVSKRNKLCNNGCGKEVLKNSNLCKRCRALFGLSAESEGESEKTG
jgi:hypothetical protein